MASDSNLTGSEIAVLAVAGRFPGAATIAQFWSNIREGVESVRRYSDEELLAAGEDPSRLADPAYVRASPYLDGIAQFDAEFFGMSPRDASVMDPQHRLFLEVAWEAMERAGYSGSAAPMATGVFAATGMNHYLLHHVVPDAEIMRTVGEWLARHNGNDMNFMATRAAYQLNLRGPAMNVQTACSSSLTALHIACQSLLNREIDLALVGASTVALPQDRGYLHQAGEILSSDGHCRPFDGNATGTLFGSGVGCVVLKRLADAIRDGDTIAAVIRGTAINNDGSHKAGYLAPSVDGQARVVSEALAISGVDAETIGLIEAHGTGTAIGDPIEVAALNQVYASHVAHTGCIALGSVKANIGHLGEAAGMAGFIKAVLALQHGELPPSVNFTSPNPQIDFASGPFYVNTHLAPWPRGATPRRAAVTALGVGGTNAHVILEEAPATAARARTTRAPQLLTISARTSTALARSSVQLADALAADPSLSLPDVAWTLQQGRSAFPYRRAVVARDAMAAARALRHPHEATPPLSDVGDARLVFMFPGGGAQYAGMGADLYHAEPAYREAFDACLAHLPDALKATIQEHILASSEHGDHASALEAPHVALPALFATEYATARLLSAWGVSPTGLIGHSMGEYVAACLAGVFSLRDALQLVMERARLFAMAPVGGMLSVELAEAELMPLLGSELSIAAVNGPTMCVASGPLPALDALEQTLRDREVSTARIHIAVAAHSAMLEPILDAFRRVCSRVPYAPPTIPFISNLTGTWITPDEATDPDYWVRHLRHTVRFGDGLQTVLAGARAVLVEVGPGRTLCTLARAHSLAHSQTIVPATVAVATMRHPRDPKVSDVDFLLRALGRIWEHGGPTQLAQLHDGAPRRRIPLPTYPFERQRFWIEASVRVAPAPRSHESIVRQQDIRDWFSMPAWQRSALNHTVTSTSNGHWLLFADRGGVADAVSTLRPPNSTVLVTLGERFARRSPTRYVVRAHACEDIAALFEALALDGCWPEQIVHMWALDDQTHGLIDRLRQPNAERRLLRAMDEYFASTVCIVKAIAEHEQPITLTTVARGLFCCSDNDAVPDPAKALLLGPTLVAPREVAYVQSRCIDVALGAATSATIAARLLKELQRPACEPAVALRPNARWVRVLQSVPLDAAAHELPRIRDNATILITGGLGGIGLEIAEYLARTVRARLVLVGRTALPDRSEWTRVAQRGGSEHVVHQVKRLLAIEAAGGTLAIVKADVTNVEQMAEVVSLARSRFGAIHGVIHAAGTLDDGLMSLMPVSTAIPVIAVKALGALVLDQVLGKQPLDFFVAFSSISSLMGLEGQASYTAANAFLDAFVERKRRTSGTRAIAIGWNAWRDVGMTASIANAATHPALRLSGHPGPHPDLERVADDVDGTRVFSTVFSRSRQWMLSEHVQRNGEALLPGAGYLELARASMEHSFPRAVTVLANVTFLAPFFVAHAAPRVLRLRLAARAQDPGQLREFTFVPEGSDDPCVMGEVGSTHDVPEPTDSLACIRSRCGPPRRVGGFLEQPFMDFGPRWSVVTESSVAGAEALVHLELPSEFHADLATYPLHPALLDMATGGAQELIPGFDQAAHFFVPLRYDRLLMFGALTPELFSHVRYDAARSDRHTARFDVDLFSGDGTVLVQIRGFTMKRLSTVDLSQVGLQASLMPRSVAPSKLQTLLATAMSPREGVEAFDRILASGLSGHIVASSVDLPGWAESLEARRVVVTSEPARVESTSLSYARPNLSTSFVGPRNALEQSLSQLWSQLLGIEAIGMHDDFFELGGQSLVAVRLFSRIRKQFHVDLPLSTLFEAPTIAQCAAIIALETAARRDRANDAEIDETRVGDLASDTGTQAARIIAPTSRWQSLVVMQSEGDQPAFVCVAGMGGTLTNLRKLASLLGHRRPFWGLQPPGAGNPEQLLYSVEALAAHYIDELRRHQATGPYLLGGYSGGGTAAFEMARQLIASGEQVAFLGLIDSFSPALPQRSKAERALIHAKRALTLGPGYLLDTVRRRLGSERHNLRLRMARQLGRVMPDTYRYDAIQDSWIVAERRYRPVPIALRATLLRAREESAVSLWSGVRVDGEHGWGRYLRGGVDVQVCPGNHTTICEEPNVRVLASRLRAAIDLSLRV